MTTPRQSIHGTGLPSPSGPPSLWPHGRRERRGNYAPNRPDVQQVWVLCARHGDGGITLSGGCRACVVEWDTGKPQVPRFPVDWLEYTYVPARG